MIIFHGLKTINNKSLSKKQYEAFCEIGSKYLIALENKSRTVFKEEINLFEDNKIADDMIIDVFSPSIFYILSNIFKEDLSGYYQKLYYCINYLKISFEDFKNMTPIEIDILFNNYIEDKKKQSEDASKNGAVYNDSVRRSVADFK